jgi:hypothetical protein
MLPTSGMASAAFLIKFINTSNSSLSQYQAAILEIESHFYLKAFLFKAGFPPWATYVSSLSHYLG